MRLLLPILLLAAVFAALQGSLSGDFVYDDRVAIQGNPQIRSLANVPSFFGAAYWDFLRPEEAARIGHWRPLTATALAIGHAAGDGTPAGFRGVSLAVHLLATLAAFALARRVGLATVAATLAAAVYGLHPIQVEAVAWSSSVADPLLGLFGLLATERYVAWRQGGSRGLPLASLAAFAAALFSKEVAVVLLLMPPIVDRLLKPAATDDGEPSTAGARRPLIGFGLLLVGYFAARVAVFGSLTAGVARSNALLELPFARTATLRLQVLGDALANLAAPLDLAIFYVVDPLRGVASGDFALELLAIACALGLGLWILRRGPGVALFGFALALLPLIPVVVRLGSIGRFALADRYLVLSAAGFGLVLASLADRTRRPAIARAALAVYVAALGLAAWQRVPVWNDEETLYTTAAEESPESPLPHWSLGRVLLDRFQKEPTAELANRALNAFTTALDIAESARLGTARALVSRNDVLQSNVGLAWTHLAVADYDGFGDYETPQRIFELQLDARPDSREAWTGLGVALNARGQHAEAVEAFQQALRIDPKFPDAHFNLGQVYYGLERWNLALESFERALELRSGRLDDYLWAARAAVESGSVSRADRHLTAAETQFPGDPQAPTLEAMIAIRRNDYGTALARADEALRRDPEHALAHGERAKALQRLGQENEALLAFRRACDFGPGMFEAHYNVAAILLGRGANDEALPYLRRAYELCPDAGVRSNLRGNLATALQFDREGLRGLAQVDARRNDLEPALYWVEGMLELDADDVEALRIASGLLMRSLRPADAAALLTRADELDPGTYAIVRDLAFALLDAGDTNVARVRLLEALDLLDAAFPGDAPPMVQAREQQRATLENALGTIPIGPSPAPSNPQ